MPYLLLLFVLLLSASLGSAAERPDSIRVGAPFPNVVLPSLKDGRPMSIADFRGKKVILHIFASW